MVSFTLLLFAGAHLVEAARRPHHPRTYMPPNETTANFEASTEGAESSWTTVLGNALYFYDAQRAGDLSVGEYPNRVPWRNNSVLNDGKDVGLDLSRGFFDAGNYIKCTFPFTFTMFALSWGALSYGPGIDSSKQTIYYDSTLRWGFDWLMEAHPSDDVLVVQVGDTETENNYWGPDIKIPEPRPTWQINETAPGTDAWASAAAAFAMGSMAFRGVTWNTSDTAFPPASIEDKSYSAKLLEHAKSLYHTAVTVKPYTVYSDTHPKMDEAYGSSYYTDDLITSGLALAIATDEPSYYAEAYNFYTEFALSKNESMWGWESRLPAAYVLFAEIAHARPTLAERAGLDRNLTGWQTEAEYYFDTIVDQKLKNGTMTPGGLLSYGQLSNLNSLQPALAAATLLFRYAPMATTEERQNKYRDFAQSQIDYWLGKNPMNAVYMVGLHPNSPKNPHSAPASGADMPDDINTEPLVMTNVIYGGVVGGPLIANDKFHDIRDDWVQSEISLDYNANAPVLAAYALSAKLPDPFYVTMTGEFVPAEGPPCDAALPCDGSGDEEGTEETEEPTEEPTEGHKEEPKPTPDCEESQPEKEEPSQEKPEEKPTETDCPDEPAQTETPVTTVQEVPEQPTQSDEGEDTVIEEPEPEIPEPTANAGDCN